MIIKGQKIGESRITPIGPLKIIDKHTNFYPKTGRVFIQYVLENLLQRIVAYMHTNVSEDFDNIVVVDGIEGVGKSAITYIIAELFQPGFDFERQLTYTSDQLEKKLRRGDDKHSVFWLDEAYELVGKRDWQKDDHKKFVKNLVKMRSRNWTLLMDIPRMEDSDAYIRDHRARIWITVEYGMRFDISGYHERGVFSVQVRSRKSGKWEHVGYGYFPDMPPEVKAVYKKYKEASQEDDLQGRNEEAPGSKYKQKYENERKRLARTVVMLRNVGVPIKDICEQLHITRGQYNHLLNLDNECTIDEEGEEWES